MSPRLLRFLLSLLTRLRLSIRRIALALGTRFAAFWRSILASARLGGQRLHASNAPVAHNSPAGEHSQRLEPAKAGETANETLATLPVRCTAYWQDELPKYQALVSGHQFKFVAIPGTPERGSQRYKARVVKQSVEAPDIPAGQKRLLSALPSLPEGWRRHVNPEGNVLFYHEDLRIFTESDIFHRKEDILFCATALIQKAIETAEKTGDVIMDELTEIVLNVDDRQRWHYYFVDHRNRLLFWVQPVRPHDLGHDLQGISEFSHIRYLVEAQYWYASPGSFRHHIVYDVKLRAHCEYYPHNRTLPDGVFEDLRGMLNCTKIDMMTTDSSSSPFAQDELVAILDLVNSLKDNKTISDPYSTWVIARLMAFFTENQFLNFCGQPCARLNADTPLFGQQTWNRSNVFRVVNVFLFGSPNEHAVRLQRVWVDGIIIQPRWKNFINRLAAELARYTIFSTVMLAVNFSFLAVPGVVIQGTPASPIQTIIYCSIVSTTGSIVFSFALLNVYSDPGLMDAGPAAEVMKTLSQTKLGMGYLAITHSLPIACLIWSIALFSTALAIQIFEPKQRSTVVTLGVECFILVLFGIMSRGVMRLFSKNDEEEDADGFAEDDANPTKSEYDVELGSAK